MHAWTKHLTKTGVAHTRSDIPRKAGPGAALRTGPDDG